MNESMQKKQTDTYVYICPHCNYENHYNIGVERAICSKCDKVFNTQKEAKVETEETVNHPAHYNKHPSGVECIEIVRHFNFNVGNAIKYLWRAGLKGNAVEDLRKAAWYIRNEIERIEGKQSEGKTDGGKEKVV